VEETGVNEWEMLSEYVDSGSQAAFEELVRRYTPLVYSSALRRVGYAHADDVTQAVFVILARKAHRLRQKRGGLATWLFATTRFAASEVIRKEKRRLDRERIAAEEQQMMSETDREKAAWRQMRPMLDAALDRLAKRDRQAVLLRFFQGASFAEVGEALGVAENTATKRVSRALEKLRRHFTRRGLALSVPVLSSVLVSRTAEAVTAGLAESCVTAGLASAEGMAAASGIIAIANGAMKAMLVSQAKAAAATGCAVLAAGSVTVATVTTVINAEARLPLRLEIIEPFPLIYKARSTLPDGRLLFQLNSRRDNQSHFVSLGDTAEGFRVMDHSLKSEERQVPGLPSPDLVDLSELTLARGEKRILLVKGLPAENEHVARFASKSGNTSAQPTVREVFEMNGDSYEVISIDPVRRRVAVRHLSSGQEQLFTPSSR